jgi:hypothetical protein
MCLNEHSGEARIQLFRHNVNRWIHLHSGVFGVPFRPYPNDTLHNILAHQEIEWMNLMGNVA